jgi:uncharacterized membrane protein YdjX (TVP38/TMEM64 family)
MNKSLVFKMIILCLVVVFLAVILNYCRTLKGVDVEDWREYILSFGILAPLIFVLIYTFLPITFFPASLLTIVSGVTFGVAFGSLFTFIGSLTGSILAYFISSYFGKDTVMKILGKGSAKLKDNIEGNGFSTILIMRFLPIVPFNVVSYSAGLAGVSFFKYIAATALGVLPEIFIYTYAGNAVVHGEPDNIGIALTLLVILSVATMIVKIIISRKDSFKGDAL